MRDGIGSTLVTSAGSLAIWEGWLLGPIAWAVHQNVSYGLTYWICGAGTKWPIYLATLTALAVTVAAGWVSWRLRQSASAASQDDANAASRTRFVTTVGVLICALSAAGILVETLPVLFLDPCAGAT